MLGQGRQAGATRKIKVARHGEVLGQGRQAGATPKIKVARHGEVLGQGRQAGATPREQGSAPRRGARAGPSGRCTP